MSKRLNRLHPVLLFALIFVNGCGPKYVDPPLPDQKLAVLFYNGPGYVTSVDGQSVLELGGRKRAPRVTPGVHTLGFSCSNQQGLMKWSNYHPIELHAEAGKVYEIESSSICAVRVTEATGTRKAELLQFEKTR